MTSHLNQLRADRQRLRICQAILPALITAIDEIPFLTDEAQAFAQKWREALVTLLNDDLPAAQVAIKRELDEHNDAYWRDQECRYGVQP
jgi:hypothetical protein